MSSSKKKGKQLVMIELTPEEQQRIAAECVASERSTGQIIKQGLKRFVKLLKKNKITIVATALFPFLAAIYDHLQ
jgi:hypothetical protein